MEQEDYQFDNEVPDGNDGGTGKSADLNTEGLEFPQTAEVDPAQVQGGDTRLGASFRSQNLESPANQEDEISDGIATGSGRASLSAHSHNQINEIMKEEQEEFAYQNMDKGSDKEFDIGAEEEDKQAEPVQLNLNMEQLIQNPGRPSQGSGSNKERKSATQGTNIFASKVRQPTGGVNQRSDEKTQPRIQSEDLDVSPQGGGFSSPGAYRNNVSSGGEDQSESESDASHNESEFNLKEEMTFEKICMNMVSQKDWNGLAIVAKQHLQKNHTSSWKAFFYYGIAKYKQGENVLAIAAFEKSERIYEDDAQLHYNLGLAYFKVGNYKHVVQHLKKCILLDNKHPYAYNNLAFLFNIHMMYKETLNICRQAKEYNRQGHNTHMHWAFAEFKEGNIVKAIKKIRKGVQKQPNNAECWIVWGLILRSAGKYKSAKHKFVKALKLAPNNETAKGELNLVKNLMHFDELLPTDAQIKLSQEAYTQALGIGERRSEASNDRGMCSIF